MHSGRSKGSMRARSSSVGTWYASGAIGEPNGKQHHGTHSGVPHRENPATVQVHERTEPPDIRRQEKEYVMFRRDLDSSAAKLARKLHNFSEISSNPSWSETYISGVIINILKGCSEDVLISYVSMTLAVLDHAKTMADTAKDPFDRQNERGVYTALIAKYDACKTSMINIPPDDLETVARFVDRKKGTDENPKPFWEVWLTILAGIEALKESQPEKVAKTLSELLPEEDQDEFQRFFKPSAPAAPPATAPEPKVESGKKEGTGTTRAADTSYIG